LHLARATSHGSLLRSADAASSDAEWARLATSVLLLFGARATELGGFVPASQSTLPFAYRNYFARQPTRAVIGVVAQRAGMRSAAKRPESEVCREVAGFLWARTGFSLGGRTPYRNGSDADFQEQQPMTAPV
jgi:hypothetical protein